MAIMRQQARFVDQLYATGMVDDNEVRRPRPYDSLAPHPQQAMFSQCHAHGELADVIKKRRGEGLARAGHCHGAASMLCKMRAFSRAALKGPPGCGGAAAALHSWTALPIPMRLAGVYSAGQPCVLEAPAVPVPVSWGGSLTCYKKLTVDRQ